MRSNKPLQRTWQRCADIGRGKIAESQAFCAAVQGCATPLNADPLYGGAEMDRLKTAGLLTLVVLALPLLVPWVALYLAWFFVWGAILRVWFWHAHAAQGRPLVFVYSESPNWQEYVEANILPRVADHAVVLNWSERRLWAAKSPWESRFFYRFAGDRNFNPLALVFCRCGRIKAVRFHKAFLDYKHGKESGLRAAEAELFALLDAAV